MIRDGAADRQRAMSSGSPLAMAKMFNRFIIATVSRSTWSPL